MPFALSPYLRYVAQTTTFGILYLKTTTHHQLATTSEPVHPAKRVETSRNQFHEGVFPLPIHLNQFQNISLAKRYCRDRDQRSKRKRKIEEP